MSERCPLCLDPLIGDVVRDVDVGFGPVSQLHRSCADSLLAAADNLDWERMSNAEILEHEFGESRDESDD
jgi:hypothetical protein